MRLSSLAPALAGLATLVSAGCTIGKDSLLFVTDTALGVNFDAKPPTLDIAYGRSELVIGPTFEENRVLPVLSSVGTTGGSFGLSSNHSFATGDAAVVMANALTEPNRSRPSDYGIIGIPAGGIVRTKIKPDDRKRVFFGTKTVLGASVQWSTANVPDAIALGFKRKELAFIPLVEDESAGQDGTWDVRLSSLIATADAGVRVGSKEDTGMRVGQLLATGEAATALATHAAVRRVLGPAIIPHYDEAVAYAKALQSADARTRTFLVRAEVYEGLQAMAEDPTAIGWVSQLDGLPAPALFDYDRYSLTGAPPNLTLARTAKGAAVDTTGFQGLADYRAGLTAGIGVLTELIAKRVNANMDAVTGSAGTEDQKLAKLDASLAELTKALAAFDKQWATNDVISGATLYFVTGRQP